MRKIFRKKCVLIAGGVLLVSLFFLTQLSLATGILKDNACTEVPTIENIENDDTKNLVSMHNKLSMHTDTKEHLMRIEELISDYKKGIEDYVG